MPDARIPTYTRESPGPLDVSDHVKVSDTTDDPSGSDRSSTFASRANAIVARYNVLAYGAVGNGSTSDTTAFQNAINQCGADGGGRVLVPGQGRNYSLGNLTLTSPNVVLEFVDYPTVTARTGTTAQFAVSANNCGFVGECIANGNGIGANFAQFNSCSRGKLKGYFEVSGYTDYAVKNFLAHEFGCVGLRGGTNQLLAYLNGGKRQLWRDVYGYYNADPGNVPFFQMGNQAGETCDDSLYERIVVEALASATMSVSAQVYEANAGIGSNRGIVIRSCRTTGYKFDGINVLNFDGMTLDDFVGTDTDLVSVMGKNGRLVNCFQNRSRGAGYYIGDPVAWLTTERITLVNCHAYGCGTGASATAARDRVGFGVGGNNAGGTNVVKDVRFVGCSSKDDGTGNQKYGISAYENCQDVVIDGCDLEGNNVDRTYKGTSNVGDVTVVDPRDGILVAPLADYGGEGWNVKAFGAKGDGTLVYDGAATGPFALTNAGTGGTDGTFNLIFSGGGGTGAAGTFTVGGGVVRNMTLAAGGTGYTSAPTVAFTNSTGLTGAAATVRVEGGVVVGSRALTTGTSAFQSSDAAVVVTNQGSGGTAGTFALIVSGGTGGSGLAGSFTVAGGVVTAIWFTNPGSGYTGDPTLSFANSAGITGVAYTLNRVGGAYVGKNVLVESAGPGGRHHYSSVNTYFSPTAVTMADAAGSTAATGFWLVQVVVYRTDDSAAFLAARNAAAAAGGKVKVPEGVYWANVPITTINGLTLEGVGPKLSVITPKTGVGIDIEDCRFVSVIGVSVIGGHCGLRVAANSQGVLRDVYLECQRATGTAKVVTAATASGSTLTFTVTAHGYAAGTKVSVRGANEQEYNGVFTVSATNLLANSFQVTAFAAPATTTATTPGSITVCATLHDGDGLAVDGDQSLENNWDNVYCANTERAGVHEYRQNSAEAGGIVARAVKVNYRTCGEVGILLESSSPGGSKFYIDAHALSCDNFFGEAMVVIGAKNIRACDFYLSGTITGRGVLSLCGAEDSNFTDLFVQNSSPTGYLLEVQGATQYNTIKGVKGIGGSVSTAYGVLFSNGTVATQNNLVDYVFRNVAGPAFLQGSTAAAGLIRLADMGVPMRTLAPRFMTNGNGAGKAIELEDVQGGQVVYLRVNGGTFQLIDNGFLTALLTLTQAGVARAAGGFGEVPTLLIPSGIMPANLTTVTAFVSGTSYYLYAGRAPTNATTATVRYRVTTAFTGGTTWGEVGIFKGTPVVGGAASLTRLGTANITNTVGLQATAVTLTGCSQGDDVWIALGSNATTPAQFRGALADDLQTGVFQSAAVRPSLAATPQSTALVAATLALPWVALKW